MLTAEQLERFNEHGYVVIDDFLPGILFYNLLAELRRCPGQTQYQIKPSHYSHVFQSDIPGLPTKDEPYIAKFDLLKNRETLENLNIAFFDYLVPAMKEAKPETKWALFPGAVRLSSGSVYRCHQDAYAGSVGYSYFVNDGWRADWGGLLTYVRAEDDFEVIYPKANRLLLRNEKFKHFHYLNSVEQFAMSEQFIILGWADAEKGEYSAVRGEYHAI